MNKAVNWLVSYFENPSNLSGKIPPVCFPTDSSTEFERKVWTALGEKVGFGKTVTYSQLAGTAIDNPSKSSHTFVKFYIYLFKIYLSMFHIN